MKNGDFFDRDDDGKVESASGEFSHEMSAYNPKPDASGGCRSDTELKKALNLSPSVAQGKKLAKKRH
jgi:hypothetical protein